MHTQRINHSWLRACGRTLPGDVPKWVTLESDTSAFPGMLWTQKTAVSMKKIRFGAHHLPHPQADTFCLAPRAPQNPKPSRIPGIRCANREEENGERATRGEAVGSQSLSEVAFKQMEEWSGAV